MLKRLLKPSMTKRKLFFLAADAALITGAVYLAFWLRFDGVIPENYAVNLKFYIAIALAVKLTSLFLHDMYDVSWRFFGLKDLLKLFSAVTLSSLVLGLGTLLIKASPYFPTLPRSVVLVDYLLTLGSIGVLRISKRAVIEYLGKAWEDEAGPLQGADRRRRRRRQRDRPGHADQQEIQVLSRRLRRRQPVQKGDEHPRHQGAGNAARDPGPAQGHRRRRGPDRHPFRPFRGHPGRHGDNPRGRGAGQGQDPAGHP